jgi:hypothetical protein
MPNANRNKGLWYERDVAGYCRDNGMPDAERKIATGFRTKDRTSPDLGDIRGVPGVCIQAKYLAKPLAGKALADTMAETRAQADASGAALYLVIEKRHGHANVGESWAHMPANLFASLITPQCPYTGPLAGFTFPVRVELRHIVHHIAEFSRVCSEVAA